MSNALTSLVPILTGVNWQDWSPLMEAYLMSQGQWYMLMETRPELTTSLDNHSQVNDWDQDNAQAIGNMCLRLAPAIHVKVSGSTTANNLWGTLKAEYGKPGIAATYSEFKALLEVTIPSNAHPGPTMDKIQAHFTHLKDTTFVTNSRTHDFAL
ncbi:hypothetical protein HYDPIDRAFT_31765 [Hydnomerulius pinastri MD-312]|uniref:Retrotransposon Copia-like N-terminal domain-containing protein n=1 Tax=Hydnomerulius pinastri MD-312 TaxID=994086 RepID=A0A0C9W3Z8_9AGAM|nr:hypothetical protein HYDPIDRAFT_31765 [Hydnomerulius pinastri MD-312]